MSVLNNGYSQMHNQKLNKLGGGGGVTLSHLVSAHLTPNKLIRRIGDG